jgi:hypothetical protein
LPPLSSDSISSTLFLFVIGRDRQVRAKKKIKNVKSFWSFRAHFKFRAFFVLDSTALYNFVANCFVFIAKLFPSAFSFFAAISTFLCLQKVL